MSDDLTKDEFDALGQISRKEHRGRPSACVARNTKRLVGIKMLEYGRDGQLALTEKGQGTYLIYRCIDGLRRLRQDAQAEIAKEVAIFLLRKGHIVEKEGGAGFEVTARGSESLADIEAKSSQSR